MRVEGTWYEAPDIGDYTVPSLSWVVAMAHRDYIVHRGIYSRCRRRFLPTRRFLIAGLAGMTCLALDPLRKIPEYERCFRGAARFAKTGGESARKAEEEKRGFF